MELMDKAERMQNYLIEHHSILRNSLKPSDWLHMYAHSIRDYDLSMEGALRQGYENGALYQ